MRDESREQRAESREQRAESREQRAESREERGERREERAERRDESGGERGETVSAEREGGHNHLLPAQQVRPDLLVELVDLFGVVQLAKLGQKVVERRKEGRVEVVEQRPQLGRVVLQRRAAEQVAVLDAQRAQVGRQRRVLVLEAVGLVHHHVPPRDVPQDREVRLDDLVAGERRGERKEER